MKKRTRILLFLYIVIFLSNRQSFGQENKYSNEKGDFVCFFNDSVLYGISNNDAFGTFRIGEGKLKPIENNKFLIVKSNSCVQKTSKLYQSLRKDSNIVISVLDSDSLPMTYVSVWMKDKNNKRNQFRVYTNTEGQLMIDKEIMKRVINKDILISLETVGFFTEKEIVLQKGCNYTFQSVISIPFTIDKIRKKMYIEIAETNIVITEENYLKLFLYKIENDK
jgi:hypothetical protein